MGKKAEVDQFTLYVDVAPHNSNSLRPSRVCHIQRRLSVLLLNQAVNFKCVQFRHSSSIYNT